MNNNEELLRHSLAHVLAAAVTELYPNALFAIGPSIENGFYYDIDFGDEKINDESLKNIEKKMKHLVKQNLTFERSEKTINDAIAFEKDRGQVYKQELIEDLAKEGETSVSYFSTGKFIDLCRGPHLQATNMIKNDGFKLTKLAGAYWRGNEKNKMLTRLYGVAFESKEELEAYSFMMAEAEKRDHRRLGRELDLFHIDEKVGLGLPLWHPKGAILWRLVEDFWYQAHLRNGYELVRSPHIGNRTLWETSGHWGFYNESMYPPIEVGQTLKDRQAGEKAKESEEYLLKPMNCPFHVQIFKHSPRSYRDFPMRWAECGTVYRFEKKGELSGLTRVRGFTQDDAHIMCRADQVENELKRVVDFILYIFKSFGFDVSLINVYLSLRDSKNKDKYAGDDAGWELTEATLRKVAIDKGLNFTEEEGEAAFYGPKLDFKLKDALGREWQCSTLQFDFNLPNRFEMAFTNNKNEDEKPYVLHRALFGSFERFLALLIEHYSGAFPLWIAPTQISILSVGEGHIEHCHRLADELMQKGFRVKVDDASETVGNKTRKAINEKVPYILVVGDKEMNKDVLSVRERGERDLKAMTKGEFVVMIEKRIGEKK